MRKVAFPVIFSCPFTSFCRQEGQNQHHVPTGHGALFFRAAYLTALDFVGSPQSSTTINTVSVAQIAQTEHYGCHFVSFPLAGRPYLWNDLVRSAQNPEEAPSEERRKDLGPLQGETQAKRTRPRYCDSSF